MGLAMLPVIPQMAILGQRALAPMINAAPVWELVLPTNAALLQDSAVSLKVPLTLTIPTSLLTLLLEYCAAPDCQFNYGPACDANKVPSGTNTSSIPRNQVGSVLYGSAGIYDCSQVGDMALTFDDGPFIYTSHILDLLAKYNAKATFFVTGNNNGKST
jgi:hypothetical protein